MAPSSQKEIDMFKNRKSGKVAKKLKRIFWIKDGKKRIKVRFIVRSRKEMGDYIALNWLEPRMSKKYHIKPNTIIVRRDWWTNPEKRKRLDVHEMTEINLRERDKLPYTRAHEIANKFEHKADPHLKGRK